MSAPAQCPLCGGTLEPDREVDQGVREGDDVVLVRVRADVCGDCHQVLLHPGMASRLAEAAESLRRGAAGRVVGRVFRAGS